jgi:hypothetical protein
LAERRLVAEQLVADLGADDRHRRAAPPVLGRQEAALRQLKLRTSMKSAVVPATMTSRSRPPKLISEVPTASGATRRTERQALQRGGVVDGQVARRAGDRVARVEAAGLRAPGQDDDRLVPSDENWSTT